MAKRVLKKLDLRHRQAARMRVEGISNADIATALGVAGAFTAVADDATAASWNPGGRTTKPRRSAGISVLAKVPT